MSRRKPHVSDRHSHFGDTLPLPQIDVTGELRHHLAEARDRERLRAVADRFFRTGMDLDEYAIRPDRDRGFGKRGNQAAFAGSVARVNDYGKMRQLIEN